MLEIEFDGQKEGEEVLALFHKSIWVFIKDFALAIFFLALPFIVLILKGATGVTSWSIVIGLFLFFYFGGRGLYLWSNNLFLVTNLRVISLNQSNFFSRRLEEAYLDEVSQVSAEIKGPIKTWLNFGQVMVQTEGQMFLEDVERPYIVKQAIFDSIRAGGENRQKGGERRRDQSKNEHLVIR